jgi:hypothetical protein
MIGVLLVALAVSLTGCVPEDQWAARVDVDGAPEVAFCASLDLSSISASVRVDEVGAPDKFVEVWKATGEMSYGAGDPLTIGVPPAGMTSASTFDPSSIVGTEIHVLATGTKPGTSSSRGLEAIFQIDDLASDVWTSNDARHSDQPCA